MSARGTQREVLLLCDDQRAHADTLHDHIQAIARHSRHRIQRVNPRGMRDEGPLNLNAFDAVVVHFTLSAKLGHLEPWLVDRLAAYHGPKLQFLQDEYRWVDEHVASMLEIGIDTLFTLVPESQLANVYGSRIPSVRKIPTLAGYVPDRIVGRRSPSHGDRRIDVGYRARPVPYWLGRLGRDKIRIGEEFLNHAGRLRLRTDIAWSEDARLYGRRWEQFLSGSRATLGVESGASIVDHDGSIERTTIEFLHAHPDATFDEAHASVLQPFEGNAVINVLSPRVFEAAAFRSLLVLFPGSYSGILEPTTHYVPLARDLSNVDEVAQIIVDPEAARRYVDTAYADLVASGAYSYKQLAREVDAAVDDLLPDVQHRPKRPRARRFALKVNEARRGRTYAASYVFTTGRLVLREALGAFLVVSAAPSRRIARRMMPTSSLWPDLVRLGAVGRRRQVGGTQGFGLEVAWENGFLTMTSVDPGLDTRFTPELCSRVKQATMDGSLRGLRWIHLRDGGNLWFSVAGKRLALEVGGQGSFGVHDFAALVGLARTQPKLVAEALDDILRPETRPS